MKHFVRKSVSLMRDPLLRSTVAGSWLVLFLAVGPPSDASYAANPKALVILANFSDAASTISRDQYDRFFNDDAYTASNASLSVNQYLQEVSRGAAGYEFVVTDWITLPYNVAHYVNLDGGGVDDGPKAILRDAVAILETQGFDFGAFDHDQDGCIDLVGLVHRGSTPEYGSGQAPDWSTVPIFNPPISAAAFEIRKAWMITDSNPSFGTMTTIGGVIHEMIGHGMCDVPDLNGWNPGRWDQMFMGVAREPTHVSGFVKERCRWAEVYDLEAEGLISIPSVEQTGRVYRIWIDPYRETEYFLLEYRRRVGLDKGLPGEGLLIWHVNLSADQTGFLYLEQADGRNDLAQASGNGADDDGDPFPGATGNTTFNPDSNPESSAADGSPTGIRVASISEKSARQAIEAEISPSPNLAGITLVYDETYPGYGWGCQLTVDNMPGEHTAVRFTTPVSGQLTRIKLHYYGPPLSEDDPFGFDVRIFGDFNTGQTLSAQPRRRETGRLAELEENGDWFTLKLETPLALKAGEVFIVDLTYTDPMVSVDVPGRNDGNSYFRLPGETNYQPLEFDLRVRAQIDTTALRGDQSATFQDSILTIPRMGLPGFRVDATALQMRLADDGLLDLVDFAADFRYILAAPGARFENGRLTIDRLEVSLPGGGAFAVEDVVFRLTPGGRFLLTDFK